MPNGFRMWDLFFVFFSICGIICLLNNIMMIHAFLFSSDCINSHSPVFDLKFVLRWEDIMSALRSLELNFLEPSNLHNRICHIYCAAFNTSTSWFSYHFNNSEMVFCCYCLLNGMLRCHPYWNALSFSWLQERNGDSKVQDSEPPTPHSLIKMGSRSANTLSYG